MLELTKGQALDISKDAAGAALTKLRVGAGWDVASGKSIDLDLWLIAKGQSPLYFNNKSIPGATLDKDDRTGGSSADGADENMHLDLTAMTSDQYVVVVNIYDAVAKGQFFRDVQRAFIEIVDEVSGAKLANYNMTEAGGDNSALVAGKLTKVNGAWTFTAVGEYSTKDIVTLVTENGGNA